MKLSAHPDVARYAIYYCPPQENLLNKAAEEWLGYSAWLHEEVARPDGLSLPLDQLSKITSKPAVYGFHATLKAPMRLAEDCTFAMLSKAVEECAGILESIDIKVLTLRWIGSFLALVPDASSQELQNLSGAIVGQLDSMRAPLTDADIERRNPSKLTPNQLSHLHQWGYPYVGDEFRFHMTLSGPVAEEQKQEVENAARQHFGDLIDSPIYVDQLVISKQLDAQSRFRCISAHPLQPSTENATKTQLPNQNRKDLVA